MESGVAVTVITARNPLDADSARGRAPQDP